MSDVKVGDVRRRVPSKDAAGNAVYRAAPFTVVALDKLDICVRTGGVERWMFRADVERCPLWPDEHDEFKDAQGYEVKTRGGPATRMFAAFEFIAEHSQAPTAIRSAAERVLEDITPATLEAMDAAAALVEAEITPRRTLEECHVDFEAEREGQTVELLLEGREFTLEAERALAVLLIQREVQRRKERGHG